MKGKRRMPKPFAIVILAMVAVGAFAYGCSDDSDSTTGDDLKPVKVVVLRNGTDFRLPDAYIVVDGDTEDACYTEGPGDTEGGDCDFVLTRGEHRFVVSKPSYQTLDTICRVTGLTKTIYFALYTL
jgi:hypothetical protein